MKELERLIQLLQDNDLEYLLNDDYPEGSEFRELKSKLEKQLENEDLETYREQIREEYNRIAKNVSVLESKYKSVIKKITDYRLRLLETNMDILTFEVAEELKQLLPESITYPGQTIIFEPYQSSCKNPNCPCHGNLDTPTSLNLCCEECK